MNTDEQLKAALAKMLPDLIQVGEYGQLWWIGALGHIRNSELLHLCSIAESGLSGINEMHYLRELALIVRTAGQSEIRIIQYLRATWQQRVAALAKIKNIEI